MALRTARKTLSVALVVPALSLVVAARPVGVPDQFRLRSFEIPTPASSPIRIALGADANLWFAEWNAGKIGRITSRGVITEFRIPTAGATPTDITAGPDRAMWFTEGAVGSIGRITLRGSITEFRGEFDAADGITAGPDGNIWFTETAQNKVWRLDVATSAFTGFAVPTPDSSPMEITTGPDGNLWFTETDRIGRITPEGVVTEFGAGLGHAFAITGGPDGNVWFAERFEGRIGKVTPDGLFTFYLTPRKHPGGPGVRTGREPVVHRGRLRQGGLDDAGRAEQGIADDRGQLSLRDQPGAAEHGLVHRVLRQPDLQPHAPLGSSR